MSCHVARRRFIWKNLIKKNEIVNGMMNHTFQFITSIKQISKEHTPPKNLYEYTKYQRTKSLIYAIYVINLTKNLNPKSTPLLKILYYQPHKTFKTNLIP
jgi:hypothetical protein